MAATEAAAPKVELRGVGLRYFGREGETAADRAGTGEGVAEVVEGVQIAVPAVDSVNLF